ncbi:autotransporter outer membrane beta-barrel domain-containing protein, partial [Escherichia coli]
GNNLGGYDFYTDAVVDTHWRDGDVFTLNIANTTIDDDYEALYFTDSYKDGDVTKHTNETFDTSEGVAVNLDVESNINISNNSRVAGIALSQGNTYNETYTTESHTWDNNISVKDSTVTSGSNYILDSNTYGKTGHFGNSDEPSDYAGPGDVAMSFTASGSDYAMKNNVFLSNSTLMGDVAFTSTWNSNFDPNGHDSNGDGVKDTNGGWTDDSLNVDELNLTLDNGSKWVGQAIYNVAETSAMYDVATNSLTPDATYENNDWKRVVDDKVFQSGVFNVALNNGSEWDTTGRSIVDTLTVNNGSQVNVSESKLTSDTIDLTNGSSLNIGEDGYVDTDHLTINSYSTVALTESTGWGADYNLYANTITVTNGGVLDVNVDQFDTEAFRTDKLELTSGNIADHNGNVVSGVFDIHSSDYVLNADLVNDRTWDTSKSNYGYGIVAMNSDGHLTINGNGDVDNGTELDNSSVDNVVAATGNYKVRIDNATGAGAIADYKDKEIIYVNDVNTNATFSAANKADLGAYTYQAEQRGNTVVLQQMELTDYANMALSIPSANTNIWNLEQDTVGTRLTNSRHGLADNGGAWVSYFGGNFNGDNGTINYDQDVNGIMVGVDTKIDGNNAKWIVGAAAGFAKGDMNDRSGQVDQDSQTAYIYSSAHFANNVFVDGMNGDSIDNGTEGSAVRVGLGTQFSFTKNFSAYTDANYLGGGDVDQDWSANVGVKYTW